MKKLINFLLNKKLLLIIASIFSLLITIAFIMSYFNGFIFYWDDYFWFTFTIAVIFFVAYYLAALASFLIDIRQSNLDDIEEQKLEDVK